MKNRWVKFWKAHRPALIHGKHSRSILILLIFSTHLPISCLNGLRLYILFWSLLFPLNAISLRSFFVCLFVFLLLYKRLSCSGAFFFFVCLLGNPAISPYFPSSSVHIFPRESFWPACSYWSVNDWGGRPAHKPVRNQLWPWPEEHTVLKGSLVSTYYWGPKGLLQRIPAPLQSHGKHSRSWHFSWEFCTLAVSPWILTTIPRGGGSILPGRKARRRKVKWLS